MRWRSAKTEHAVRGIDDWVTFPMISRAPSGETDRAVPHLFDAEAAITVGIRLDVLWPWRARLARMPVTHNLAAAGLDTDIPQYSQGFGCVQPGPAPSRGGTCIQLLGLLFQADSCIWLLFNSLKLRSFSTWPLSIPVVHLLSLS